MKVIVSVLACAMLSANVASAKWVVLYMDLTSDECCQKWFIYNDVCDPLEGLEEGEMSYMVEWCCDYGWVVSGADGRTLGSGIPPVGTHGAEFSPFNEASECAGATQSVRDGSNALIGHVVMLRDTAYYRPLSALR